MKKTLRAITLIMEAVLNFYSKLIIGLTLIIGQAHALDVNAVYLSSCAREVGLITEVSSSSISIFNLKGRLVKVPRYEIVGLSSYPIDKFPAKGIVLNNKGPKLYSIKTLYKRRLVHFVTGWPIRFSKDKLTFLSINGEEITFARSSIWEIQEVKSDNKYKFTKSKTKKYDFLHPTSLKKCKKETFGKGRKKISLSPQEFVSDPVVLKRRFDTFFIDKKAIDSYERTQSFYAVPEVYKNQTTLGLWTYGGSRHGASNNRANNWTPILENQFSSGPFGYQHIFTTGANTNDYFIHEEPQTQIYYSFKADYFHLSYYMDPTLVLMGKRYRWFEDELGRGDYRVNDMNFIELGFDFGHFSLLMQAGSEVQIGFEDEEGYFFDGSLTIPKYGFSYRNHLFFGSFLVGQSTENVQSDETKDSDGDVIDFKISEFDLRFLRVNFGQNLSEKWSYNLSYIQRNLVVDESEFSTSVYSAEIEYKYSYKYIFKSLSSIESLTTDEKDYTFLKLGLSGNLVF